MHATVIEQSRIYLRTQATVKSNSHFANLRRRPAFCVQSRSLIESIDRFKGRPTAGKISALN